MKDSVKSIAKSVTSAVKEEAERLQELVARLLAAESSEESEEEGEPSALHDLIDNLSTLRQKLEAGNSPMKGNRRKSWRSHQLEMSSIDVYLDQSKAGGDQLAFGAVRRTVPSILLLVY